MLWLKKNKHTQMDFLVLLGKMEHMDEHTHIERERGEREREIERRGGERGGGGMRV